MNFLQKKILYLSLQNLPSPSNYLLGPGDELLVFLWGETELAKKYIINKDGNIFDDKVGMINLTGKNINEAKAYLVEKFSKVYSTLTTKTKSTFLEVSLGKIKSINVSFVGRVNNLGIFPIHPFSTIISGLIQAGGIDTTGSLRNIYVKRNGKTIRKFDFYDYIISGNIKDDIRLMDQDVILVPVRQSTVYLDSSIYVPGIYEITEKETLKDLINIAGGIKPDASDLISIERITPINMRNKANKLNSAFYVNVNETENVKIYDGDKIIVPRLIKSVNRVEIIGQAMNPGSYKFFEGMMLSDLINLSGGMKDKTFIKSISKRSAEIIRRNLIQNTKR